MRNSFCHAYESNPVDLKSRKSTGTSCQIEIHFSIFQIIKFLVKYHLLCLEISGRLTIFFIKDSYKVSTSFTKENKRYK